MKVEFKATWFAPNAPFHKGKRSFSGRRFKRGIHDIPEELAEFLPTSAKLLDEEVVPAKVEKKEMALSEVDLGKQELDAIQEKMEEAEENFKKERSKKKK